MDEFMLQRIDFVLQLSPNLLSHARKIIPCGMRRQNSTGQWIFGSKIRANWLSSY